MKTAIIASFAPSILNFRKQLVQSLCRVGVVYVLAPYENNEIKNQIIDLGAKYIPIDLNRQGMNPLQDLKSRIEITKILKELKPDHVLSYTIKPVIWGSKAAHKSGVKNIHSMITGLGYAFASNSGLKQKIIHKIVKHLYKNSLKKNQTVFFQNKDDLALFTELGLLSKNTKVKIINGSGVCLERYAHNTAPENPVRFLMIARLLKDKGTLEYLAAAKKIRKSYPNVECHLVGYLENSSVSISRSNLDSAISNGDIIFHGKQEDVRPIIAMSSVYVLPSYREGTPRSVLEAMSMGRPIITTDAPGCRETVIHGENGYLVTVKNIDELVQAMERFIKTPNSIKLMGNHSRRIAEEKYDVNKVNTVILSEMGIT